MCSCFWSNFFFVDKSQSVLYKNAPNLNGLIIELFFKKFQDRAFHLMLSTYVIELYKNESFR